MAFEHGSIPHDQIVYLRTVFDQDYTIGIQLLPLLDVPMNTRAGLGAVIDLTSIWLITFYPRHAKAVPSAFLNLCRNILSAAVNLWGVQQFDYHLHQIATVLFRTVEDPALVFDLTRRWKTAAVGRVVNDWDNQLYKEALLSASPHSVLNALYDGTEVEKKAGLQLLNIHLHKDTPPLAVVPAETLIQWCREGDADRFLYIAAAITLLETIKDGRTSFSTAALGLLEVAPDRGAILETWTDRLQFRQGDSVLEYLKAAIIAIDSLPSKVATELPNEVSAMRQKVLERVDELAAREQLRHRFGGAYD